MRSRFVGLFIAAAMVAACGDGEIQPRTRTAGYEAKTLAYNVLLNTNLDSTLVNKLNQLGKVKKTFDSINAVSMKIMPQNIPALLALPEVDAANPNAERKGSPIDTVEADAFDIGLNTWDMDAINVSNMYPFCDEDGCTPVGIREVPKGEGVYVAVLDTGLLDTWRQYFPEERIATQYAISFGGGGGEHGQVSTQPNKWEHDVDSHGTHVTSSILGYSLGGTPVTGAAPRATVIPVKVLGQSGFGWSAMVAAGIEYVADLKAGPLAGSPVVINMSLGGPVLDAVEKAAMDYALSVGVIIVAAAGNEGEAGMGYPGGYAPVISVAAAGWVGEWQPHPWFAETPDEYRAWWHWFDILGEPSPFTDFPLPGFGPDYYITDFSSRELAGQDLDVAAPGSWIVGPYQLQRGKISYYFLGGTSMASPHVAGVVALMAEKKPDLTAAEAESILESTAVSIPAGCQTVKTGPGPLYPDEEFCWGDDASGAGMVDAVAALAATP